MSGAQRSERLMVVTGAGRGIGRAIVEGALAGGWSVAALDVNEADLDTLRAEFAAQGDRLFPAKVDISDAEAVDGWLDALISDHGSPTALVNNAAIVCPGLLEHLELAHWREALDVNLTGTFVMTQRVGRHMIAAQKGAIVSIASIASMRWTLGSGGYPASKAGVAMLMEGVALEWGKHGIRANAVSPGYTETPMTAPIFANPDLAKARLARVPIGRQAQPSDIAAVVLFLCSPAAAYVTGQNIAVDGGATIATLFNP